MTKALTDRSRKSADQKLEQILAAALAEFTARGFESARESIIARDAGVSAATLRQFFPGKAELFREVVRSTIISTLQEPEPGEKPDAPECAACRVRDFARWFWRVMDQPSQSALLRLSIGELHRFPELAVFHATEVLGRSAHRLERVLMEGNRRGEFQVADPRVTSRVILAALLTHAHWFAHPEVYGGITGLDRERAESAVLDVLVDALRPAPPHST